MENSKIWIPEKNYFVLLLPLIAHKSNGGIIGYPTLRLQMSYQPLTKYTK